MGHSIICLGNRLLHKDRAGPAVYDRLQLQPLPLDIEIIEGGTAGLNLLPLLEHGGRIVFVDSVAGFTTSGQLVVLDQETITAQASTPQYGHDPGLPHVLSMLSQVCENELPEEIVLIGIEGECSSEVIEKAAELSLFIATNGLQSVNLDQYC